MRDLLLIAAGGALGAVSRYGAGGLAHRVLGDGFPWGTLVVNLVGCLLLGVVMELAVVTDVLAREARLVLAVGFLGAFTTFSTFGYESVRLLEEGAVGAALANVAASVVVGFGACWGGIALVRALLGGP